jgi:hypothetical protein
MEARTNVCQPKEAVMLARNILFAVMLVAFAAAKPQARLDVVCQEYNAGGGEFGCECTCSSPDSCGGNENDCEIGGFDDFACYLCYGSGAESEYVAECSGESAKFHCTLSIDR